MLIIIIVQCQLIFHTNIMWDSGLDGHNDGYSSIIIVTDHCPLVQ